MRNDAAINQDLQRMRQIELTLDNLYGACHLRQPEIAALVQQALLHFDGERYRQIAWVIMPNHVHTIIETFQGYPLGQVVHSWKSYTALAANRLLRRTGMFWNIEYFDRVIRDEAHLNNAIAYIHNNPVKAHLVQQASDWPYSSAQWYVS
jgi:REP element-mobilizing transposase RayT